MALSATFEEIDRAMDAVQVGRAVEGRDLGQICAVWPPIKLILKAIEAFVPQKWRDRIDQFIVIVDAICHGGGVK